MRFIVIPCLIIMKCVTDINKDDPKSIIRRNAFDCATELQSLSDTKVVIEGILYNMIKPRLNEDHKKAFESIYYIDDSAKDVKGFDVYAAIKWIANKYSRVCKVIIITENSNIEKYKSNENNNITVIESKDFVSRFSNFKAEIELISKTLLDNADLKEIYANKYVDKHFF